METKIYIVLSRDSDFLFCTTDSQIAETAKLAQIKNEEMGGGRPSVYIKETILNNLRHTMQQIVLTAHSAGELNGQIEEYIRRGWTPVGSHVVVCKLEQLVYEGMQHKRTQYDYEYSQTLKK